LFNSAVQLKVLFDTAFLLADKVDSNYS